MYIYKDYKGGRTVIERVPKYYNFEYEADVLVPLYDSDNTQYIEQETHTFKSAFQTTTTTYNLVNPIYAKDITAYYHITTQAYANNTLNVKFKTSDGMTYELFNKRVPDSDWGQGDVTDSAYFEFPQLSPKVITSFIIYVARGQLHNSYNGCTADVYFHYTKVIKSEEASEENHNVKLEVPKLKLIDKAGYKWKK